MTLTTEDLQVLQRPFKPSEHKYQFGAVWIREEAITARIEEIDPAWSFTEPIITTRDKTVTAVFNLTIKGVTRAGVGMSNIAYKKAGSDESEYTEDEVNEPEKAAATDALKRAARLFGIGRYLLYIKKNSVRDPQAMKEWLIANKQLFTTEDKDSPVEAPVQPAIQMASEHANGRPPLSPGDPSDHEQSKTSAAKIETVKTELDKNGKLFIKAGPVLLWTREAFRELGIDVSKWETPGVHKLPAPLQVNYTGQGKSATLVSLAFPDGANPFSQPKAG